MEKNYIKSVDCELYQVKGVKQENGKFYEFYKIEIVLDNERFTLEPRYNKQVFDFLLKREAEKD